MPGTLEYSPVEHIIESVLLSEYTPESLVAMWSTYCDASGGTDQPVQVVAGLISTTARWKIFETDWRIALASFGVPYFHMKEFAHSRGPFSDWKGQSQRTRFLRTLIDIIASNVECGVGMLLPTHIFRSVDKIFCLSEELRNPFSACAVMCIVHGQRVMKTTEMQYFFECGDVGRGDLEQILLKHGHPIPLFQPSRDRGQIRGVVPLQAADFLAYELLKSYKIGESEPEWKHRESAKEFHKRVRGDYKKYSEVDLIQFCMKLSIPQRATINAHANAKGQTA
jgi:hypothetical protein